MRNAFFVNHILQTLHISNIQWNNKPVQQNHQELLYAELLSLHQDVPSVAYVYRNIDNYIQLTSIDYTKLPAKMIIIS